MPTPLSLTTEEVDLLLSLAQPIDQRQRDQFLHKVAAELEAKRQAGEIGEGSVHRVARTVQRRFFDPPQLGESKYRRAWPIRNGFAPAAAAIADQTSAREV